MNFANQNGVPVGQLSSVAIDKNGFITASYSNGQTQKLYQIPLAQFTNPDQLTPLSSNVYEQSEASGVVNLAQAGNGGAGTIASSSLEASNVELANELTTMIIAQRSYEANAPRLFRLRIPCFRIAEPDHPVRHQLILTVFACPYPRFGECGASWL